MKKILILLITTLCLFGCTPTKPEQPETLTGTIQTTFVQEVQETDNLDEIGQAIIDSLDVQYELDINHVVPGYLPGFTQDIVAFDDAVMIAPIVGTIPFVCYVLYTEKPELLMEALETYHDMRWNICTEAEEMVLNTDHNLVLFAMTPKAN